MTALTLTRRQILAALAALAATGPLSAFPAAASDDPVDLEWDDLIPEDIRKKIEGLLDDLGTLEHGDVSPFQDPDYMSSVTTQYNGKTVRLPGFVVPLEYSGVGVTSLLLVPYVGACIHVPPPPPNQLVYVTTDKPYEFNELFEAVWVTGVMTTTAADTELAEAGYTISDGSIERYIWE